MSEVTFTILNSGKVFYDGIEFELSYVKELKKKYNDPTLDSREPRC